MTAPMPAAFIGHGSPMATLQDTPVTRAWREWGASLPRPRAVVAVSAHWYINASAVTAMEQPRTIHDFYGFPPELFAFEYPAPGSRQVAEEVAEVVAPMWLGLDEDSWGLDHGSWSVLAHVFPDADIPVLQLSVDGSKPFSHHYELGARLAPLLDRGVLVVASGNIVHNRAARDTSRPSGGTPWAEQFDADVRERFMGGDPAELVDFHQHPYYPGASPTPDHFLPLLYFAGLAGATGRECSVLVDGPGVGSVGMTAYTLAPAA